MAELGFERSLSSEPPWKERPWRKNDRGEFVEGDTWCGFGRVASVCSLIVGLNKHVLFFFFFPDFRNTPTSY